MLLIIGLGLAFNHSWSNAGRDVLGYATEMSDTQLLTETNRERAAQNLGKLAINKELATAAQAKAEDMVAKNYWAHIAPDKKTPWDFIKATGYNYELAGENLAYGFTTSADAVKGWMNSPGHRANILKGEYKEVGFGIATSPNFSGSGPETVVVALYAQPALTTISFSATVPQTPQNSITTIGPNVLPAADVSRLEVLAGDAAPWMFASGIAMMSIGLILVLFNHGRAWHAKLIRGEQFVLHHPLLDVMVVAGTTSIIIMSQTSGFIK